MASLLMVAALAGMPIVAVSAGGDFSLALAASGALFSWGRGEHGKLGHGDERHQQLPTEVAALPSPPPRTP